VSGGIYGGNCGNNGCGVVFKVTQSGEETVLYEFQGGGDGGYPQGSLAIDPSGTLYGSASSFGGFGAGVVYKVDQTGNESTLYTFNPSNYGDGGVPIGGVVRDSAGNLFGTTLYGGNLGEGTLFKIDSAGVETILYSFGAYFGDALLPYASVSLDSKGNAYGIAYGGAQGYGAIYEVSPSGTDAVLYSFGPPPDGQPSYIGDNVVLDKKGNLYGVTSGGGTFGFGIVYKIDSTGKETILHNFGGPDGKNPIGSLVFDPKGNLYGTTSEGGAHGGGVIFRITP
jgi:uncharacterized repeat protein (TIGR03803 family)